jgi:hypothetical protein
VAEPSRTWFEEEPPLAASGRVATTRIGRRALVSWPRSVAFALLVGAALTLWRARAPSNYEVTVVLRVSDGGLQPSGSDLGLGALRTYVSDRAFSSPHLITLMGRRPDLFPSLAKDPVLALTDLRERLDTDISDNDFIEERGSGDPPRSARVSLSFRASSPDAAWTIAHDLADLLIGSTRARERALLEEEERAAGIALEQAQADLQALARVAGTGPDPTLVAVRERVRVAEQLHATAQIALRASAEQQALRLELVDTGRLPERINRTAVLASTFLLAFLITLTASWLLAGAFDPRVLDGEDLTSLGIALLGQTTALPTRTPAAEGRTRAPRAPRV